ncbi:hypothetical protein [Streptomyces sp. NBC_01264]|uniref:hypothetical protein n=1 Tax=Streptomyces sp. NBC_01264 TaxID=2903804 RepID=UPI002252043F|nr:hypothetical protein [Streptomyces sp. NBC_01264]MCX4784099.1 hypothetical protein [Streptomyces sp. NBC_01264]
MNAVSPEQSLPLPAGRGEALLLSWKFGRRRPCASAVTACSIRRRNCGSMPGPGHAEAAAASRLSAPPAQASAGGHRPRYATIRSIGRPA